MTGRRQAAAVGLLLAAAAAPALPPAAGLAVLAAVLAAWVALRPPPRELVVVLAGGAVALAALAVAWRGASGPDPGDAGWRAATLRGYAAAWRDLDGEAAAAGARLTAAGLAGGGPTGEIDDERRLAAVRLLEASLTAAGDGRQALMLIDPDGEPVAWAGEGLLHELPPEEVPAAGRAFEASFGAVTLLSVEPLEEARRPWRVVAARSIATDRLPFAPGGRGRAPGELRWSLVEDPVLAADGATVLPLDAAPALVVEVDRTGGSAASSHRGRAVAWLTLGLALFLLAAMRGIGLALQRPLPPAPATSGAALAVLLLATAGAAALAKAAGASDGALAALALGLVAAAGGWLLAPRFGRPPGAAGRLVDAAAGAAAVAALAAAAFAAQAVVEAPDVPALSVTTLSLTAPDLAARLETLSTLFVLRLALTAAAVGLLALAGGRSLRRAMSEPASPPRTAAAAPPATGGSAAGRGPLNPGEPWVWLSLPLLLAAAALCDRPVAALVLFAAAGAALAAWLGARRGGTAGMVLLLLLAGVLAAGVWETAHRQLLRRELAERVLPRLGALEPAERQALSRRVGDFFAGADLTRFVPRSPEGLGRDDLAFLLWQASPLARPHALSRLRVQPIVEGVPSSFSFGVPVDEVGMVDEAPDRWQGRLSVPLEGRLLEGTSRIAYRGEPWALVRWSLLPLPGFRLGRGAELENVEAALLRGLPGGPAVTGLPESTVYVYYGPSGRAFASPWREDAGLAPALAGDARRETRVATPAGLAWAASRPVSAAAGGGWEVIYLPLLAPRDALERVGTRALEVLLAVLALALLVLAVALPRPGFRHLLVRTWRSYSRRLLLVYTGLLLVPLLLLNVVLVTAVQNRLRQEQRTTGEAALASAQRVVGDYLASVEPGFDLANVLDDELLLWISEVLRHEINLYWGSEVWASSKPELFTARLLPKRIPGESYAAMAFLGHDLAARTNRVGDISYLELYAPLHVGGAQSGPSNFFLSMPLLAQQEEVARELANLRRQALLVTAVLIVLATAVGVRLSRSFSRPLTELVEGTRRIAAGAPSLDLAPSELELAALVEAVDEMAHKIALGRERLVREKQVVDRMVQHITSGIVSVDRDRRVLMRNRVAEELLGVAVGDRLDDVFAGQARLAGLAPWLAAADREIVQRTVRLLRPAPAEGDGDSPAEAEGAEREWTLVWVPVPGEGEPAALLVVEDVTETLRSQRLEAWAEMARIIAHEIKNPLTPIRLNIEHLQQVWNDRRGHGAADEHFAHALERCTGNVLAQVDELRQIASEFSTYSRIPKIDPRPGDLVEALRDLAEPYRAAPPPGVVVEVEAEPGSIEARFDRRLLARAVRNLVENALRASAGGGKVVLRVERQPAPTGDGGGAAAGPAAGAIEARIAVLDCGPGIDPSLLQRIFDPYFSTYDTGTGLGLPIARRIAEEHGGTIGARNRPGGGLEVYITLPAA
jgi:signal transduction histidine kinase